MRSLDGQEPALADRESVGTQKTKVLRGREKPHTSKGRGASGGGEGLKGEIRGFS